jgi:CheY-like chemotaxis protein
MHQLWEVRRTVVPGSEQKRVLLVDDETVITDSLVTIFTAAGYEVAASTRLKKHAPSCQHGVRIWRSSTFAYRK